MDLRFINIWLVVYLPLWKMMDFVSWDDDIPNWMEKNMFQTTNQNIIWYFMDIFSRHVHRFSHGFPMVFPWLPKRPTDLCVLSWKNSGRAMASPRTLKSSGTWRGSDGAVEFWAKSGNINDVYYYWKRRKTQKTYIINIHISYIYIYT